MTTDESSSSAHAPRGNEPFVPRTVALFGLGYVGCVSACALAEAGHRVIGVEVVPAKVDAINRGEVPFLEPGLPELARQVVASGRLSATDNAAAAVAEADLSLICVGTPSTETGLPKFDHLYRVCESIGEAIRAKDASHDVVIRSTVLPGTAEHCTSLIEQVSGRMAGDGFHLVINPEFLREGTALADYRNPPFTVVGAEDERAARRIAALYANVAGPCFMTGRREAELVKYSCNLFHAVKVVFANEIGRIAKTAGIDSHAVMEIFCHDDKLNLSRYYLKPGFAYGGSCLPKDLRAIVGYSRERHVALPMLEHVAASNREQIESAFRLIEQQEQRKVGLIGFSFKPSTDDLRESPLVILAEMLIGKGYDLKIYDPQVVISNLLGANRGFLEKHLPHAAGLITDQLDDLLEWAECLVVGSPLRDVGQVLMQAREDQTIIDLVRAAPRVRTKARYHGLGWEIATTDD
ncbi:MAG: nucleotide sugar dehydrogenase [Pirellulales bacterium]|nr:nucleotide sugar dehydrogenase [Pirellulales bacterium]